MVMESILSARLNPDTQMQIGFKNRRMGLETMLSDVDRMVAKDANLFPPNFLLSKKASLAIEKKLM